MIVGGKNLGRVGFLKTLEEHPGAETIAYITDLAGRSFNTLASNVFIIGETKPLVTLPPGGGIKLSIVEAKREKEQKHHVKQ
jgi:small subunit ribosomal protein S4e